MFVLIDDMLFVVKILNTSYVFDLCSIRCLVLVDMRVEMVFLFRSNQMDLRVYHGFVFVQRVFISFPCGLEYTIKCVFMDVSFRGNDMLIRCESDRKEREKV